MPSIAVTPHLSIEDEELVFTFARASGPGGQNVNKVESAVHLRFDVLGSPSLDEGTKRRLCRLAGRRLTSEGVLVVFAQAHRSQERNREEARARLIALIAAAVERPKARIKTRPTLASKRRRIEAKVHRGTIKRLRGPAPGDG